MAKAAAGHFPGVHRLDGAHPGAKVTGVLFLALGLVAGETAGLLATAALAAVLLAGHPDAAKAWLALVRRLRLVFLFIAVLHGWLTPGPMLVPALGAFSPTAAGLLRAAQLAGVVAVMAALVAVLIRTTSTAELAAGISWTLRPLRGLGLDVARFSRLLAWTVERVEAVRREASAVRDALRLRRPRVGGARGRLGFETAAARAVLWRAQAAADRNAEALYLRGGDRPLAVPAPAPVEWLGLAATGLWAVGWAVW